MLYTSIALSVLSSLVVVIVHGFSTSSSSSQQIVSGVGKLRRPFHHNRIIQLQPSHHPKHHHQYRHNKLHSKIIDVEVIPNNDDSPSTTTTTTSSSPPPLNLVEYSQNQDPEWKDMKIAFCDEQSNTYIDCTLAFYVKDASSKGGNSNGSDEGSEGNNGVEEYALGVPCEVPIVVALETDDNDSDTDTVGGEHTNNKNLVNLSKVVPINPDQSVDERNDMSEEEKEEIFQLAARALTNEYDNGGNNKKSNNNVIRMKKTPRVLTLECSSSKNGNGSNEGGGLDAIIGDWKEILLGGGNSNNKKKKKKGGGGLSIDEALEIEEEEEEDYFDKIMKRDLGDDYMNLVDDIDTDEGSDMNQELLKLFDTTATTDTSSSSSSSNNINNKDDDNDDDDELNNQLDNISEQESKFKDMTYDNLVQQLQPSAALRLLNFEGPNGREYTILRPLRPILLVGKEDPEDYTRRILLSEEERRDVLPRLEGECRMALEEAGFFVDGTDGD